MNTSEFILRLIATAGCLALAGIFAWIQWRVAAAARATAASRVVAPLDEAQQALVESREALAATRLEWAAQATTAHHYTASLDGARLPPEVRALFATQADEPASARDAESKASTASAKIDEAKQKASEASNAIGLLEALSKTVPYAVVAVVLAVVAAMSAGALELTVGAG